MTEVTHDEGTTTTGGTGGTGDTSTGGSHAKSSPPGRRRVAILAVLLVVAIAAAGVVAWMTRPPAVREVTTLPIRSVPGALGPPPAPATAAAQGGFRDAMSLPWS